MDCLGGGVYMEMYLDQPHMCTPAEEIRLQISLFAVGVQIS